MNNSAQTTISKSDYRRFREAPRHLWAKKNIKIIATAEENLASIQGEQVEQLAKEYIQKYILPVEPGSTLGWQETLDDGPYHARADALVLKAGSNADLYEIKSSTSIKPEDVEDAAFQALIFKKHYNLEHIYLVVVNNAYTLHGKLDLFEALKVEDITKQVFGMMPDIEVHRKKALHAAECKDPNELEHCWKPKDCHCIEVCHPGLPEFSIYDIPRIGKEKLLQLENIGISAAKDIPTSFALSNTQNGIAELARLNDPVIDVSAIRSELNKIEYPIYFLDYETCGLAIPVFENYKPYQATVTQYSLHRLDGPGGKLEHFEFLARGEGDPSLSLLASLKSQIGASGSVIVWYKGFEATRNKEMALLHPEYSNFLEDVNTRIFDLMEVVSKGLFLHPGFKGSSSIKNVLPVMVPELSYAEMEINNGMKASLGWWNIMFSDLNEEKKEIVAKQLLEYCKLDTLAMVEIFKKFVSI